MVNVHPEPARPDHTASLGEQTLWLLRTHAFCAPDNKVVELFRAEGRCWLELRAFQCKFRPWHEMEIGPNGGIKFKYAAAQWEMDRHRLNIQGILMRPDRDFPVFQEGGEWFKNIYRKPVHSGTGDLKPLMDFLAVLLPSKREREWLLNWMAHKWRYPAIPGTAVLFVADSEDDVREGTFGTGRGMLFKIGHRLYGEQYARAQRFAMLDGSSSQSTYTDWMHNSLLATVDESRTSATAHRRGERSATYEVLKDIVDPAPKQHYFTVKYRQGFDGMSYCSFWVATNHADALAIPRNDRRFTILTNGRKLTPEESAAIAAWMEIPGNIAALAQFLEARDISNFNMYEPLDTQAKEDMAELAIGPVESVLRDLMADDKRGLVFTRPQLEEAVERVLIGVNYGRKPTAPWQGEFNGAFSRYCTPLKAKTGSSYCRIRVGGFRVKLYAFRTRRREAEKLSEIAQRRQAAKWGPVDELKNLLKAVKSGVKNTSPPTA